MFSYIYNIGVGDINLPYCVLVEFVVSLSLFIVVWVSIVLLYQIYFHSGVGVIENENNFIEFGWTVFPSVLVLVLSVLNVSCFVPTGEWGGSQGVSVVGRQWYWSYGSSAGGGLYDSVMGDFIDSVDKPLRLTCGGSYCLFVTSADVIHSFSVPFLSVKVDAIPGRVNQFSLVTDYFGRHVGYCTELCGAGHSYMPIVIEVLP